MAIASPTVQAAAMAAMNTEADFFANVLFPRCPIIGAALKPGDNTYRGTAYKVNRNQNIAPDEVSDEYITGVPANTIPVTLEDYEVAAKLYHLSTQESLKALPTLGRFGIDNWLSDVAAPTVMGRLLVKRELRALTVATTTGNYAANTAGNWADDTSDPIEQIQLAFRTIQPIFRPDAAMHEWILNFSMDAWHSFVNNAAVRARFAATQNSPANPGDVIAYLTGVMRVGNDIPMRIHVASASQQAGNIGQNATPSYILSNKAMLVCNAKSNTAALNDLNFSESLAARAQADLRIRSWGRGYVMLDPTIRTFEIEDNDIMKVVGEHATTDTIFDASGGYLWTAPASNA